MSIKPIDQPKRAALLLAGALACALLSAGPASAQPQAAGVKTFTDPNNRFSFQHPASIAPDVSQRPNQPMAIMVGIADYECAIFAVDRPESAGKDADVIKRSYSTPIPVESWKTSMDGFALYGRKGTIQSGAVDTTGYWPVQTAAILTDEGKPAIGALQARPGVEVWQFCTAYDGKDHSAFFKQVISTFAGTNDAQLQAQGEAVAAQRTAQEAAKAAAAAEAAAKQQTKKKK